MSLQITEEYTYMALKGIIRFIYIITSGLADSFLDLYTMSPSKYSWLSKEYTYISTTLFIFSSYIVSFQLPSNKVLGPKEN